MKTTDIPLAEILSQNGSVRITSGRAVCLLLPNLCCSSTALLHRRLLSATATHHATGSGECPPGRMPLRTIAMVRNFNYRAGVLVSDPSQSRARLGRNPFEVRRTTRTRSPQLEPDEVAGDGETKTPASAKPPGATAGVQLAAAARSAKLALQTDFVPRPLILCACESSSFHYNRGQTR